VTALLAPATLHGTFYPHPASINFRVEFIIIGPDVNQVSGDIMSVYTNMLFQIVQLYSLHTFVIFGGTMLYT